MSRLVVQGDQDGGREIVLRPGINVLGRSDATDHQINDPTVSSFHCEIDLRDGAMVVKDLGSTNGTFINSIPVQQSVLQPGQSLRLGSVEMIYSPQQPASAPIAPPAVSKPTIRVRPRAEAPPPATALAPEMVPTEPPPPRIESGAPSECRNHPGVPGALICRQCGGLFCKSCVKTIRAGARDVNSCQVCGGICVTLAEHRKALAKESATFGSLLPTAFKYPLQQNGPIILMCGTILFTFLDFARLVLGNFKMAGTLGFAYWLATIMGVGYLFAYMQNIIVASGHGEDNPPGWPEISGFWDDVVVPCLRCATIWLVCAGPGIATMIFVSPVPGVLVLLLGLFCIPMAFLTVCLADSIGGLNPLVIFASISKVPGPYLIACIFFLVIIGLETVCVSFFRLSPIFILPAVIGKFVSLYGLTVEMRILGLLYYTNKEKLSWFG